MTATNHHEFAAKDSVILIVDDNPTNLAVLFEFLSDY
jgi:hypothetical protein